MISYKINSYIYTFNNFIDLPDIVSLPRIFNSSQMENSLPLSATPFDRQIKYTYSKTRIK